MSLETELRKWAKRATTSARLYSNAKWNAKVAKSLGEAAAALAASQSALNLVMRQLANVLEDREVGWWPDNARIKRSHEAAKECLEQHYPEGSIEGHDEDN